MQEEQFYTAEEVAQRLRVSPQTVRAWIRDGLIEVYRFGRAYRISAGELDRLIKTSRRPVREQREDESDKGIRAPEHLAVVAI